MTGGLLSCCCGFIKLSEYIYQYGFENNNKKLIYLGLQFISLYEECLIPECHYYVLVHSVLSYFAIMLSFIIFFLLLCNIFLYFTFFCIFAFSYLDVK
jgi:hypothetical protein